MLVDEDLGNKVNIFLQSLGKDIISQKLLDFLLDPEVCEHHGITRKISL